MIRDEKAMTKADIPTDEVAEIETAELDLQEDLTFCPMGGSDRRLKVEIEPAGALPDGLKLYSWRYLGGRRRFTGVMADDLLASPAHADAVHADADGLMRVDYGAVGFLPEDFAAMQAEGEAAIARYRQRLN